MPKDLQLCHYIYICFHLNLQWSICHEGIGHVILASNKLEEKDRYPHFYKFYTQQYDVMSKEAKKFHLISV